MNRSALTAFVVRHVKRGSAFLLVGGLGFVVDAVVYNLLVYAGGQGPLFHLPLVAKAIAVCVGLVSTYLGNRLLTYRDRKDHSAQRAIPRFVLVNAIAMGLQLGALGFSRYVLGLADVVSDNIAGTFVGQGLATGFRYIAYTKWVFPYIHEPFEPVDGDEEAAAAPDEAAGSAR